MPNCSYPQDQVVGNYAAINTPQYAASATCGACIEASSGGKSVVVQIVDQCPTCETGTNQIDISQAAFQELADLSVGKLAITWRYVSCPATLVTGNMEYAIKDGSSRYWSAIAFRNFPVPITGVQVENRLGGISTPTRMDYNYWLDEAGFGLGPYTVTVTNANGQDVVFTLPALPDGTLTGDPVFETTGTQFAGC
jgi:expansin (peptidoglycan-binding protein)